MTSIDLLPLETLRLAIKVGVLKLKGPDKKKHLLMMMFITITARDYLLEYRDRLVLLKVYVRVYTTLV